MSRGQRASTSRPNPRRANGHQRDQLIKRVRREEDNCHLCGLPVDKTLPPGLPGSPEVHELMPVSKGGDPLDRDNCRLTHRKCNRDRSNKTDDDIDPPRIYETWRTW